MKHKQLAKLVRNRPEKYPHALEQQYGRVLNNIMAAWGTPEADQVFLDLLVDRRGNRAGFPPKVAEEIYFLSELHSLTFKEKGDTDLSETKAETQRLNRAEQRTVHFREELERRGLQFVPPVMFSCISRGEFENVVLFVNAGMPVDTLNERGWTPLLVALFEGQEEIALFLIQRGADPLFCDQSGYRPIHWAAFRGYVRAINELAARGADLNIKNNFGWPPMLQAAARGFPAAVDALVERGADADISDVEGWTALHKACANGHDEVVATLIERKANLSPVHAEDGRTPLHLAIDQGQRKIAAMLLRAGAKAGAADNDGTTPLHIAAAKNDVLLVDLLLASKAKCSAHDKRGVTPLMSAVEGGATAAIRRLLAAGATIDETLEARQATNDQGQVGKVLSGAARVLSFGRRSKLHDCVMRNDFLGVRTEVEKGADPNAVGPDGMTPLEVAATHGLAQMWGVLIDLGAGRRPAKA